MYNYQRHKYEYHITPYYDVTFDDDTSIVDSNPFPETIVTLILSDLIDHVVHKSISSGYHIPALVKESFTVSTDDQERTLKCVQGLDPEYWDMSDSLTNENNELTKVSRSQSMIEVTYHRDTTYKRQPVHYLVDYYESFVDRCKNKYHRETLKTYASQDVDNDNNNSIYRYRERRHDFAPCKQTECGRSTGSDNIKEDDTIGQSIQSRDDHRSSRCMRLFESDFVTTGVECKLCRMRKKSEGCSHGVIASNIPLSK